MLPLLRDRFHRALRLAGWNALLLVLGATLIAMAGEACLRLTKPFMISSMPWEFVPNAGRLRPPNTEIRYTNQLDFWTVSRTNSLGFLDREPPSPEHAAATCHISMIGDSFVEAMEVPIHDKFHVRLEELAADELPHLNITTSAFGIGITGQVQQLPFYDEYARLLHPKLLVLVFVHNDFVDNVHAARTVDLDMWGWKHSVELMVKRRSDGKLELIWGPPPTPDPLPSSSRTRASWAARAMRKAMDRSWLALWLHSKKGVLSHSDRQQAFIRRVKFTRGVEALSRHLGYAPLPEGWGPTTPHGMIDAFAQRNLPPVFEDALQYTAFALEQFKQRADRDGAKLVILASHMLKTHGTLLFERMSKMAATLDIPVIDQTDYILRQGADLPDVHWPHNRHWSPAGHRWAAEALLEYIKEHPAICDG